MKKDDKNTLAKCLDHGASPNIILDNDKGNSMIHFAAMNGSNKILELILGRDIDIELLNNNKESALVNLKIMQ